MPSREHTGADSPAETIHCARHPNVETGLMCGRCETPICPRCVVMTDVGARCPDCAPRRKLPQFELGPLWLARGALAAFVSGAGVGLLWGFLLPAGLGFFTIFLGLGVGYAISEAVSWATNKKAGTYLQIEAALGVVLAYVVRNLIAETAIVPTNDLSGYIAVVVGIIMAANRLRF